MASIEIPVRPLIMTPEEKEHLLQRALAANAAIGILQEREATLTPKQLRERMISKGVRPQDNSASRELIRMRTCEDHPDTD